MGAIGILNTSIGSANIGDQIIMDACNSVLENTMPTSHFIHFSSHDAFFYNALKLQKRVKMNILCGTNCLSSHMLTKSTWSTNILTATLMKPVITLGVGWANYQSSPDLYTKKLLNTLLWKDGLLSVRDSYTQEKLHKCGIKNTINTSCPTMWSLTKEHCDQIPSEKCTKVIYTLTDYRQDKEKDIQTIEILHKNYDDVYIWPQGSNDLIYFNSLTEAKPSLGYGIKFIPPSLQAYDYFLTNNNVDYVGTRLHAGIRAMQKKKRALIIAVDNRAEEKRKDFSLPVIKREEINELESLINSKLKVSLSLPLSNIDKFLNELKSIEKDNQYTFTNYIHRH